LSSASFLLESLFLMNASISPRELASKLQSATPPRLLDVRQPEEHQIAALPESRLIPLGELMERSHELTDWADRDVVVYCHHGVRSLQAVGLLRQAGFRNVRSLSGGIEGWSVEVDSTVPRY